MMKQGAIAEVLAPDQLFDDKKQAERFLTHYVMNVGVHPVTIKPDLDFALYITKKGRQIISAVTLQPGETTILNNFFVILESAGGMVYLPIAFNEKGLEKIKEDYKAGKFKPN